MYRYISGCLLRPASFAHLAEDAVENQSDYDGKPQITFTFK